MKRFLRFALPICFVNIISVNAQTSQGRGLTSSQIDSVANILAKSVTFIAYMNELDNASREVAMDRKIFGITKHENSEFGRVFHSISLNPTQKIDSLERMGLSYQIKLLKSRSKQLMEEFPELSSLRSATTGTVFSRADKLLNPTKYKVTYDSDPGYRLFTKVEHPPTFPGGVEGWKSYLERNLNTNAPNNDGAPAGTYTVKVQFVTDTVGTVSNVKAIETPKACPSCAAEAMKMIAKGPRWEPAVQNGHRVYFLNVQLITFAVEPAK